MALTPNTHIALRMKLDRAMTAVDKGITYQLGHGGFYPADPLPTRDGTCDCSGFVAWVLGLSRKPKLLRPWWLETSAIWRDATGKRRVFVALDRPVMGCVVVYPDARGHQGHVGIYTGALAHDVHDHVAAVGVVDCSLGQNGIVDHLQSAFARRPDTVYCALRQDMVT